MSGAEEITRNISRQSPRPRFQTDYSRPMLDCTYRVQIPHQSGQLARVMGAIAEGHGLIGDVVTISVGHDSSVREITVEVRDSEQAERIAALIDALDGVRRLAS